MENGKSAFVKHFTNLNLCKAFWDFSHKTTPPKLPSGSNQNEMFADCFCPKGGMFLLRASKSFLRELLSKEDNGCLPFSSPPHFFSSLG